MGGGKSTVPENTMGTLNSSDYHSAHMSILTKIRYTSCAMATLEHIERFRPVDNARIVASPPNALKACVGS